MNCLKKKKTSCVDHDARLQYCQNEEQAPHRHLIFKKICYQCEGSERIIQVPGCDDCTGLGQDRKCASIVIVLAVVRLGADVLKLLLIP